MTPLTSGRFRTLVVLAKLPGGVLGDDNKVTPMTWARFPAACKDAEDLRIDERDLPGELRLKLTAAANRGDVLRTHCVVNLSAERPEDLQPSDWELS